jgi:predicted DNA-binding transcriptional regulator YafY
VAKASAQREPMERLVRLATVLHHAGSVGATTSDLVKAAGFEGTRDATSALAREFRHLRQLGWQIENVGGVGEDGRYRMTTVDNRLRVKLTPAQQAALLRAVVLADRADLVERLGLSGDATPPEVTVAVGDTSHELTTVVSAVRHHSRLRFRYHGKERLVHPDSVRTQSGKWYLGGCEEGGDVVKWFVVSRMSDVESDAPGTAQRLGQVRRTGLHPMTWEVDEQVAVTLRAPADFAPDVRRWLGDPQQEAVADGLVTMTYRVTNRAALRVRLYELGPRVEVLGPDDVRQELLGELALMAGEW